MESNGKFFVSIASCYNDPLHPVTAFQRALQSHLDCSGVEAELEQLVMLRELVSMTIGFEGLAKMTGINSKSLHRMLSRTGNPTTKNLALIICAMKQTLEVHLTVRVDSHEQRERQAAYNHSIIAPE
jgi:DNA-binding phage protein